MIGSRVAGHLRVARVHQDDGTLSPELLTNLGFGGESQSRRKRRPGSVLLAAASVLLLLLAAAQGYVSWRAQYGFVLSVKHASLPSALEALGLDAGAVVFALIALARARLGHSAAIERVLNLACAAGSLTMNLLSADLGSPRAVAVYVLPALLYIAGSDRLIGLARHQSLGAAASEASGWRVAGSAALYTLRMALAPLSSTSGLRRWVLVSTPLPGVRADAEARIAAAEADRDAAIQQAQRDADERAQAAELRAQAEASQARSEAQALASAAAAERDEARGQAGRDQAAARKAEAEAIRAQAEATNARAETGRLRADFAQLLDQVRAEASRERDELRAVIEDARADLRGRAERAESDRDAMRAELAQLRTASAAPVTAAPVTPASTAGGKAPRRTRALEAGPKGVSTKKARLLELYTKHPLCGDREKVSRVAAELGPAAGLQAGTARTYLYAELDRISTEAAA